MILFYNSHKILIVVSTLFFVLISSLSSAQFVYDFETRVPVNVDGEFLEEPWVGGLNSAQYNTIDLNNDGQEDLVVFERTSFSLKTFIASDGKYVYDPSFQSQFPEIRNWLLIRDYNCDGKKDLFVSDPRGVKVYENITVDGESLSWRIFNPRENQNFLLTQGFSSPINLQINSSDIPSITDVDNDGDLDILNFRFSGASTVEFHKNLSMERNGNCDSLQFERVTQQWGGFEDCECGVLAFNNEDCPPNSGGREEHQGGKTILAINLDNDEAKELLISEELCTKVYVLDNTGTVDNPIISSVDPNFPNSSNPAELFIFPAMFSEDVNFDGQKDLIISPNVPSNVSSSVNFESSSWLYENTSTAIPAYDFLKNNFIQDQMIDLGENAVPAFADLDNDGDQDMLVSSFLSFETLGFRTALQYYENVGSTTQPSFELNNEDFSGISVLNLANIKPSFYDIDGDGNLDLVFAATQLQTGRSGIYHLTNGELELLLELRNNFPNLENYKIFDINNDDLFDILVGGASGNLMYYRNNGSTEEPSFILEEDAFYGLDRSTFRRYPAIEIADLDANGQLDMVIGDFSGNLSFYPDFLNNLQNPTEGVSKLFRSEEGDSITNNVGARLVPVAVNLFNTDRPMLAIGTGAGGIQLLRNTEAADNPALESPFIVYPNPVERKESVYIRSSELLAFEVISASGGIIYTNLIVRPNQILEIPTTNLTEGLYLIRANARDGIYVKRFVVVR